MLHVYCTECDASDAFPSRTAAERSGWEDVEVEGTAGPSSAEANGICPDCAAA